MRPAFQDESTLTAGRPAYTSLYVGRLKKLVRIIIAFHRPVVGDTMDYSVLKIKELAEYLRVHPSTLYKLVNAGEIPGFRIGSEWRFNREQIDKWRLANDEQLNTALLELSSKRKVVA